MTEDEVPHGRLQGTSYHHVVDISATFRSILVISVANRTHSIPSNSLAFIFLQGFSVGKSVLFLNSEGGLIYSHRPIRTLCQ